MITLKTSQIAWVNFALHLFLESGLCPAQGLGRLCCAGDTGEVEMALRPPLRGRPDLLG